MGKYAIRVLDRLEHNQKVFEHNFSNPSLQNLELKVHSTLEIGQLSNSLYE